MATRCPCTGKHGATRPDECWVADISEFHCLDSKLFLAGIRDLFDQTLVGWAMGERQTTDLAVSALVMAPVLGGKVTDLSQSLMVISAEHSKNIGGQRA